MWQKKKPLFTQTLKNQRGQTFLEFLLLLVILVSMSFGLKTGFGYYMGTRWKIMLEIIATPNKNINVLNK